METKNIFCYGCIFFCFLTLFEPNLIINSVAGQNGTIATTVAMNAGLSTVGSTTLTASPTTITRPTNTNVGTITTNAAMNASLTTVGSTTVGSTTAGSTTVGSTTVGSTTVGSNTVGSTTVGSTTVGSNTVGSNTVGSTAASITIGSTNAIRPTNASPAGTTITISPATSTASTVNTTAAFSLTTTGRSTTVSVIAAVSPIAAVNPTIAVDSATTGPAGGPTTVTTIRAEEVHSTVHENTPSSVAGGNTVGIQPSAVNVFESINISSTGAANHTTTGNPNEIDQIIHDVQELQNSIDTATKTLNQLNMTLDHLIDYKFKLNIIEADIDEKVFQETKVLREVELEIASMKIIEKELDHKEMQLLVLKGQQTLLEQQINENLNNNNKPTVAPELWDVSFFAQRNETFNHKDIIHPYEINSLNEGRSFNKTSGKFIAPFDGIYHFYSTALKMKKEVSGTGRLTLQMVKNTKVSPTYRQVLAEAHMDSHDLYGWFPLQLLATASLKAKDEITVELLEGSIYESGFSDHVLTSFGGFLIGRL